MSTQDQTPEQQRAQMRQEMEERQARKQEGQVTNRLDTLMLIVGGVYPLLGIVWATVLLLQENISARVRGAWMILAATVGLILWWLVWKVWGGDAMAEVLYQLIQGIDRKMGA